MSSPFRWLKGKRRASFAFGTVAIAFIAAGVAIAAPGTSPEVTTAGNPPPHFAFRVAATRAPQRAPARRSSSVTPTNRSSVYRQHEEEAAAARKHEEEAAATAKHEEEGQSAALLAGLAPSGKTATIAALLKSGVFTFVFTAVEGGTVVIDWYQVPLGAKLSKKTKAKPVLVAAGQLKFPAAGTAKVKIKLTAAGKALLKHAKHLKLTARGTFTPIAKTPLTATRSFVLKR
jgi:hypothetical protein